MNHTIAHHVTRLFAAGVISLAGFCPVLTAQSDLGTIVKPPSVPANLAVPAANKAFLKGNATGTQNYICLPSGWTFLGPQATVFWTINWIGGDIRQQITTHFLSPNPDEGGTPRATWQSSLDTSAAWAKAIANSNDPAYVAPGAVPWLLLEVVGTQRGPTGGASLAQTSYIQRVNTSGGIAPTTACTVGATAFVPYTADYIFYRSAK